MAPGPVGWPCPPPLPRPPPPLPLVSPLCLLRFGLPQLGGVRPRTDGLALLGPHRPSTRLDPPLLPTACCGLGLWGAGHLPVASGETSSCCRRSSQTLEQGRDLSRDTRKAEGAGGGCWPSHRGTGLTPCRADGRKRQVQRPPASAAPAPAGRDLDCVTGGGGPFSAGRTWPQYCYEQQEQER